MIRFLGPLAVFTFLLCLTACQPKCDEILDTSGISLSIKTVRLETEIRKIKTPTDAQNFLKQHDAFGAYLLESGTPPDQIIQSVYRLGTDPKLDLLLAEVQKQFPDFSQTEASVLGLFKNIKTFYPDFEAPDINTFVSGFGGFTVEDAGKSVIIGLDYFMDSTAAYAPNNQEMPHYIKKFMTPQQVDNKVAYALANRFLAPEMADQRLIYQMIKFGKILYFVQQVLPCKSEAEIMDYTQQELEGTYANAYKIYSYFTKNEFFYSTKREQLRLLVMPRPNCVEIGDECPGRIGQWLGLQIVKSYAQKTGLSLPEVMSEKDHTKIFTQSGYKPERP